MKPAQHIFDFIVNVARPHIEKGGKLHSKGSAGIPSKMRQLLKPLDNKVPVSLTTDAAANLPRTERKIEHLVPLKRIAIELIDPSHADPRCNTSFDPIAGGPANSSADVDRIFKKLCKKVYVTKEEHQRLNTVAPSLQWDAPNGDGLARYKLAGIELRALHL